jgi:hypothetical protein
VVLGRLAALLAAPLQGVQAGAPPEEPRFSESVAIRARIALLQVGTVEMRVSIESAGLAPIPVIARALVAHHNCTSFLHFLHELLIRSPYFCRRMHIVQCTQTAAMTRPAEMPFATPSSPWNGACRTAQTRRAGRLKLSWHIEVLLSSLSQRYPLRPPAKKAILR